MDVLELGPPATGRAATFIDPAPPASQQRRLTPGRARPPAPRIALYSHDTMGLGHMRRNLLLAQALRSSHLQPHVLMLAGAREAGSFGFPPGVDCITLPALHKDPDGSYSSRDLGLPLCDLTNLRSQTILAAVQAFRPDVLIVDNVPRGAQGEIDATLLHMRERPGTRCVLGLRDVLDEPERVQAEWERSANAEVIRELYDAVWVYGDRAVYDMTQEYNLAPDLAARFRYTGYLDQSVRRSSGGACGDLLRELPEDGSPVVACLVGGGQDGMPVAEAFARAELPPGAKGVLVTGPYMPEASKRQLGRLSRNGRIRVFEFVPEPTALLNRATRVIAMGGYNTVTEILSFNKPALVVPRVSPRREQWVRAERLKALGLIDVLHPNDLSPDALSAWLRSEVAVTCAGQVVDLGGLQRVPVLLDELLQSSCAVHAHTPAGTEARHATL
jgi:predicted glycosyltransferase